MKTTNKKNVSDFNSKFNSRKNNKQNSEIKKNKSSIVCLVNDKVESLDFDHQTTSVR